MDDDAGRIRARRERLGLTQSALAREARVSRTTLRAVEVGEGFQRSTLIKIENALDRLELEAGFAAPAEPDNGEDLMRVEVELPDGRVARVITTRGTSPDQVADQVAAILARLNRGTSEE